MTTVEIKEKDQSDMPKIEESLETSEKENLKKLVDGEKDLKNENEVIGDGLKKDKILNKVSLMKARYGCKVYSVKMVVSELRYSVELYKEFD